MPTLNWIGKEVVVNHHQQGAFHLKSCYPLPENMFHDQLKRS